MLSCSSTSWANRIYQCITSYNNAGYVADASFWELASSFGTFKQTSENSPERLWFKRCYNENLLKIVKHWAACHFSWAEDVATKFWKVVYLYISFSQLNLSSSRTCSLMAYWFHKKCCKIKWTVTFGQLVE